MTEPLPDLKTRMETYLLNKHEEVVAENARLRQLLTEAQEELQTYRGYLKFELWKQSLEDTDPHKSARYMNEKAALEQAEVNGQRAELTQENLICSQCGQSWDSPACGPTHAAIKAERRRI